MTRLTNEQLAELRGLCEKATPLPWEVSDESTSLCEQYALRPVPQGDQDAFARKEDAEYARASVNALPALLDEVAEARKDRERLDWLVRCGAEVAYDSDGEMSHLHWAYNPEDEEGSAINQAGQYDTQREAIDAAMLAEKQGKQPWKKPSATPEVQK
jgi:hypothetical protein